jgi:hypothetical protein
MHKHDADTGKDGGSDALEYDREACVRRPQRVLKAEEPELDADQEPTDGGDHESRACHNNE